MHETSTDYGRPYRPLGVSVLNQAGRLAKSLGLGGRLDTLNLVAAARRKTGFSDFGDEWFMEPLDALVRSINREARLTPLGLALQKTRIVAALSTRLRAERLIGKHPEILDLDLGRTVLIAGLQRTGTTLLHRMIAADPGMRELRAWEALNPAPLPGETAGSSPRRVRIAELAERTMAYLAPDFMVVHPIEHDAPEEDVFLLDLSFMSQSPEATMHVPAYSQWLERQDHTRCYRYAVTMLKLLQWQRPAAHRVLKTPNHLEHLEVILKAIPDSCVVQTHRDPKKSVTSFLSMVAHARGILSDDVDTAAIAGHWLRKSHRMIQRSMEVRSRSGEERFIDVFYADLLADPLGELRRIYEHAGIELTPAAQEAARAATLRERRNRCGRHVYAPESFGLTVAEIDRHYAFYRRRYCIPDEAAH